MNDYWNGRCEIGALVGKTIVGIEGAEVGSEEVRFNLSDGRTLVMQHIQDCCESVQLEDINGDISDLLERPVVIADAVSNSDSGPVPGEYADSWTWTFYRIATQKGWVVLRWLGESNGYYGEEVAIWMKEAA